MLPKGGAFFVVSAVVLGWGLLPDRGATQKALPTPIVINAPSPESAAEVLSRLRATISIFAARPSAELGDYVLDAFTDLEYRLVELRHRAAASAGGTRAELVIQQIEIERERDAQVQRFAAVNARLGMSVIRQRGERDDLRYASSVSRNAPRED